MYNLKGKYTVFLNFGHLQLDVFTGNDRPQYKFLTAQRILIFYSDMMKKLLNDR